MAIYLGSLELATGSVATGDGIPINAYVGFRTTSTGNPPGYNSSTNIYTQTNGSIYIKSGSTSSDYLDYPDAAFTNNGLVSSTTPVFSPNMGGNGGEAPVFAQKGQTSVIRMRTDVRSPAICENSLTAPYGIIGSQTNLLDSGDLNLKAIGVTYDPGTGYIFVTYKNFGGGADRITIFNSSSPFSQVIRISPGINYQIGGIVAIGNFKMMTTSPYTISYTDVCPIPSTSAFPTINVSLNTLTTGAGFQGSTNVQTYSSISPWAQIGFSYQITSPYQGKAALQYSSTQYFWEAWRNGSPYDTTTSIASPNVTVGDPVARTDTDSTQPMFVKIK